jgi:hypothetical protein
VFTVHWNRGCSLLKSSFVVVNPTLPALETELPRDRPARRMREAFGPVRTVTAHHPNRRPAAFVKQREQHRVPDGQEGQQERW